MDKLYTLQHLNGQHQHRLQRELATAVLEEILQAGAKQVNCHDVVVTLLAKVMDLGKSN